MQEGHLSLKMKLRVLNQVISQFSIQVTGCVVMINKFIRAAEPQMLAQTLVRSKIG